MHVGETAMNASEKSFKPRSAGLTLHYDFNPSSIPAELQRIERWVTWQAIPKDGRPGKFDKVPVDPNTGRRVSHKDTRNHMTYDDAVMAYVCQDSNVRIDGIGLSLPPGLVVIDLDDMILDDGAIRTEHAAILNEFSDCYCELSPSQRGAHIFAWGTARTFNQSAKHGVELYSVRDDGSSGGQFITVSGNVYRDRSAMSTEDKTAQLLALCDRYGASALDSSRRGELPPMPALDGTPRTLEALVAQRVIQPEWEALIARMKPTEDGDDRLIRKHPPRPRSDGRPPAFPVDRSEALFDAAKMFAHAGVPIWEAFAILTNRDYELVEAIDYDTRAGDSWAWEYIFGKHIDLYGRVADGSYVTDRFDDITEGDWSGPYEGRGVAAHERARSGSDIFANVPEHDWGGRFDSFAGDVFEDLDSGADPEPEQGTTYPQPPWAGFTFEDACNDFTPAIELLEDVLGVRGSSVIYSGTNVGKSAFILDIAVHIAAGRNWRDKRVEQGPVLYIAAESPESIRSRIQAIQVDDPTLPKDLPIYVVKATVKITTEQDRITFLKLVHEQCKWMLGFYGEAPVMVIVDTFTKAAPGAEENSNSEMGQIISFLHDCAEKSGKRLPPMHWAVIHHTGKDQSKGARGAQIILDQPDTEIRLERNELSKLVTAKVLKQRKLPSSGYQAFYRVKGVQTGKRNNFGNPVTAPVVVHEEGPGSGSAAGSSDKRIPVLFEMRERPVLSQRKMAEDFARKKAEGLKKSNVNEIVKELRDEGYVSGKGTLQEPWVLQAAGTELLRAAGLGNSLDDSAIET